MEKKNITIIEVENGWIVSYTIIGSGQAQKTVHLTKAEVVTRLATLLDESVEEDEIEY